MRSIGNCWLMALALGLMPLTAARASEAGDAAMSAAERQVVAMFERLSAASARSNDLRVRLAALPGQILKHDSRPATDADASLAALVELARGSTDPIVLAVLGYRCSVRDHDLRVCDGLDHASRWTVAETQNQVAWVTLSDRLLERGDVDGSRAAFRRAAQASIWHEPFIDYLRVLTATVPDDLTLRERFDALAWVVSAGSVALSTAWQTINRHCKEPAMREPCVRIVETIWRDGDSMVALGLAARFGQRLGLADEEVRAQRRRSDAMYRGAMLAAPSAGPVPNDDREFATALAYVEDLVRFGEEVASKRALARAGPREGDDAGRMPVAR